jgi:hypothetical protein
MTGQATAAGRREWAATRGTGCPAAVACPRDSELLGNLVLVAVGSAVPADII